MSKKPKNLTPKAAKTRSNLIAAARPIIGRSGTTGINVMQICDAANVGRTSFYNYFTDVDELILAVEDDIIQSTKNSFDTLYNDLPRGIERLGKCLHALMTQAVIEPEAILLITSLSQTSPKAKKVLYSEIAQEVSALGTNQNQINALITFVSVSTLAICRELAMGKIPRDQIDFQVENLLQVCHHPRKAQD